MSRHGIYDFERGFIPDDDLPDEKPIITKADKVRQMSDEELAHLFLQISLWRKPATYYDTVSGFCLDNGVVKEKEWLDWLKEEVDE